MTGSRSIMAIQMRGSWKAVSSVVRYEKAAMIGKQLRRLSDSSMRNVTNLANQFDTSCEEIFEPLYGKLGRRKESQF